jgi:transporter family protein
MSWAAYAFASAIFAALTAVLGKVGVKGIPSNLATALRTVVVLIFAWGIVLARGEHQQLGAVRGKPLVFLVLSGVATGASWLAYYRALQLAPASRVAPIDKLSLAFVLVLSVVFLSETLTWKLALGTALMVAGALLTLGG